MTFGQPQPTLPNRCRSPNESPSIYLKRSIRPATYRGFIEYTAIIDQLVFKVKRAIYYFLAHLTAGTPFDQQVCYDSTESYVRNDLVHMEHTTTSC